MMEVKVQVIFVIEISCSTLPLYTRMIFQVIIEKICIFMSERPSVRASERTAHSAPVTYTVHSVLCTSTQCVPRIPRTQCTRTSTSITSH